MVAGTPAAGRPAATVLGRVGRGIRRRARRWRPGTAAAVASAVSWATESAAALPDHTHAAHLVGLVPPPPPGLPEFAGSAVDRALQQSTATCLQRCLVMQAWLTAHGHPCEIAVGFRTGNGFEAHAWIPGFHHADESAGFVELARVPPPGAGEQRLRGAAH